MSVANLHGASVARVVLKPRKSGPFFARHPWVLDASIARLESLSGKRLQEADQPQDGEVVDLVTERGDWIARGVYNAKSRIRVRLYTWSVDELLDDDFWRRKLDAAIELRRQIGYGDPQGAARLVFSEGDGLSGLVVDRYADQLVVQVTSLAIAARLPKLLELLAERVSPRGILVRTDSSVAKAEGLEAREYVGWGEVPSEPGTVDEHGIRYAVDMREGQKTGFYLDQRENRRVAAGYMKGRRVLDVCSYSGGFALSALKLGKASHVLAVDASQKALDLLLANAQRNGLATEGEAACVATRAGDCFDVLPDLVASHEKFGGVILDPPRFAGSRRNLDQAMRAYFRLNRLGVELLEPGGILVTCSCSGHVTREDFRDMLHAVAGKSSRDIQILDQRGAAPDHPLNVNCPESEYLKCFICRVG